MLLIKTVLVLSDVYLHIGRRGVWPVGMQPKLYCQIIFRLAMEGERMLVGRVGGRFFVHCRMPDLCEGGAT